MEELDTKITEGQEKDQESKATSQETKNFSYKRLPVGVYKVYVQGGGVVPEELSGSWNRATLVDAAIAAYVAKRDRPKRSYRKSKGATNAKRSNTAS